jgi:5-oxoprolinase (ATP-hydrolysing)
MESQRVGIADGRPIVVSITIFRTMENGTKWQFWIDTGGTFTDCFGLPPVGALQRLKVLSSGHLRATVQEVIDPTTLRFQHQWSWTGMDLRGFYVQVTNGESLRVESVNWQESTLRLNGPVTATPGQLIDLWTGEEAPVTGMRLLTQTPLHRSLPPATVRLGTTKGTNALLERKGARVALLITRGFKDLPFIGTQQRPDLFQLAIPDPPRLHTHVLEVDERLSAQGEVLRPLTSAEIEGLVKQLQGLDIDAVAIALLHSYRNPVHEQKLAAAIKASGFEFISCSHQLAPAIQLYPRTQTALVNAYLSPVVNTYLHRIRQAFPSDERLLVMSSAGGLLETDVFQPKDSLLSGPAGGVVGAARVGQQLGFNQILSLDMGGTSTDTARFDGDFDYDYETRAGDIQFHAPALSIETVAAGGGSICACRDGKLVVGPESAGAAPGPACYGAGGPLTITDVNLLLGKLDPGQMSIPVDLEAAQRALQEVRIALEKQTDEPYTALQLLRGFERIANEKMAGAIQKISTQKGFDPKSYALLAFGGAGGLHACQIADLLGCQTVLIPRDGGLLSAYGIGLAQEEQQLEVPVLKPWKEVKANLSTRMASVQDKARRQFPGTVQQQVQTTSPRIFLRLQGQDHSLDVLYEPQKDPISSFRQQYEELFGYFPDPSPELEVVKITVTAFLPNPLKPENNATAAPTSPFQLPSLRPPYQQQSVPVFDQEKLPLDQTIQGPAVLLNPFASSFIPEGWQVAAREGQHLVAQRIETSHPKDEETLGKAIELELFTNRFTLLAEEMGALLQRTAFSVNIKERLDFSCALLDPKGQLLVNAPHIPVHLGSLGICARRILETVSLGPGDVAITNHPGYGGSHLPDITLLAPAFSEDGQLLGYLINRAHHAEIGGKRPGSMPPDARNLEEEGVVFAPQYFVRQGQVQWKAIREKLEKSRFPSRSIEDNLADLSAALAALRAGERKLQELVNEHGQKRVHYFMDSIRESSASVLREALRQLPDQEVDAEERLDDGSPIRIHLQKQGDRLHLDFSGTGPVHPGNLNANESIVYSVILYVLRLLCDRPLPLNEGLLLPVSVHLPTSFLNPDFPDHPAKCPAVVGGNTEVSQRLVDTLLKALQLSACSQGTMNNFLFGNDRFGYYETIGGGTGAGPGFSGRSAVHQHMTNTRLTDPEILEFRFPVRCLEFGIRAGSGGNGHWRGGDGIVREIEFLEPMQVTLLTQHRVEAPYGLQGGEAGASGQQILIRQGTTPIHLKGIDEVTVQVGDRIRLLTPGGGGYGRALPD